MPISNGSLPCPYCEGGAIRAAPRQRQSPRRFCARCGEDVTDVRDAWCPGCGFRIRSTETPPAAPPGTPARTGSTGQTLFALFVLAVGLLVVAQAAPSFLDQLGLRGDDPSIHEPTVTPVGPPGHSPHETGAIARELICTVRGRTGTVPVMLYGGVYDAMPGRIVGYVGDDESARYRRVVGEESTRPYLRDIVATIASMTDEPDDRARIAVSLVQQIEYDDARADGSFFGVRYPYETLCLGRGVCSDKSVLLAALLRELGFGVALFEFDTENHMAVGIRCPDGYDYRGTGHAFVESTSPSIMTDAGGTYAGGDRLVSVPEVIPVAEGRAFASIETEAKDAAEWNELRGMGQTLDSYHYGRWQELCRQYGLRTTPD
jgi:hypothetical protein